MPIRFDIQPELDLLVIIFEGHFTGEDYLNNYYAVYQDPRRHHGMKILMDLVSGAPDIDSKDFMEGIALIRENHEAGYAPDHVAILASRITLQYFADTLKLMADELPMFLEVFHNAVDAVRWLELEDREAEALRFWEKVKNQV
jgi:hypothetical protein